VSVRLANREGVGTGVGAGQLLTLQPSEERGVLAERLAQRRLLGPPAGQHQVQARILGVGGEERVGQQSAPFSRVRRPQYMTLTSPSNIPSTRSPGSKRPRSTPPLPAGHARRGDAQLRQPFVAGGARRQDHVRSRRRSAERHPGHRLELDGSRAQTGVGGELGVVAAGHRQIEHPGQQPRRRFRPAGGGEVHEVIPALGKCLDDRQ